MLARGSEWKRPKQAFVARIGLDASTPEERHDLLGELGVRHGAQMLRLHEAELLGVVFPSCFAHGLPVELRNELRAREDLLVSVRPAEPREVVQDRVRKIALLAVIEHAHRGVAFGQLFAVWRQDHGQVRNRWPRVLERVIEK